MAEVVFELFVKFCNFISATIYKKYNCTQTCAILRSAGRKHFRLMMVFELPEKVIERKLAVSHDFDTVVHASEGE